MTRGPKPGNPFGHRTRCRCSDQCRQYANERVRAARSGKRVEGYVFIKGRMVAKYPKARVITSVYAPLTCQHCGGSVHWLADGTNTMWEAKATVACDDCGAEFLLTMRMSPTVAPRKVAA